MSKNTMISGYMAALGKRGGSNRSPAKIAAARKNAAKAAAARRKNGKANR